MFPALCSITTVNVADHFSSEAVFFFFQDEYQYFSPTTRLPSHKDTGIRAVATRVANGGVKRVLEKQASQQSTKKWKRYTNFLDTNRAKIRSQIT